MESLFSWRERQMAFFRPAKRCTRGRTQSLDGFRRVSTSCYDSNRIAAFNFKPEKGDNALGIGCFTGRPDNLDDAFVAARCVC